MRRQTDQAKIGSRANPTTSKKRLMRWRISHTLRSTIGRDGASSPVRGGDALSLTRMATRKARASMASVKAYPVDSGAYHIEWLRKDSFACLAPHMGVT